MEIITHGNGVFSVANDRYELTAYYHANGRFGRMANYFFAYRNGGASFECRLSVPCKGYGDAQMQAQAFFEQWVAKHTAKAPSTFEQCIYAIHSKAMDAMEARGGPMARPSCCGELGVHADDCPF